MKISENLENCEIREFRESCAARKIQTAWRAFVIRENKISKIMGEEPKYTEFDVLKESLTRNQPNVERNDRKVRPEAEPEIGPKVSKSNGPDKIVNEKTVIVRSSKTFVSGHFDISSQGSTDYCYTVVIPYKIRFHSARHDQIYAVHRSVYPCFKIEENLRIISNTFSMFPCSPI